MHGFSFTVSQDYIDILCEDEEEHRPASRRQGDGEILETHKRLAHQSRKAGRNVLRTDRSERQVKELTTNTPYLWIFCIAILRLPMTCERNRNCVKNKEGPSKLGRNDARGINTSKITMTFTKPR